jgi:formate dehydrogenase major subunit
MTTVADMADGLVNGYFVMRENPTVGSMHGAFQREGLRRAEWVVVRDFAPTETAEFWKVAPEIEWGDIKTEDIATEVFLFPCAAHSEKDGAFTNTRRLVQWHEKSVEPPGNCRGELCFRSSPKTGEHPHPRGIGRAIRREKRLRSWVPVQRLGFLLQRTGALP